MRTRTFLRNQGIQPVDRPVVPSGAFRYMNRLELRRVRLFRKECSLLWELESQKTWVEGNGRGSRRGVHPKVQRYTDSVSEIDWYGLSRLGLPLGLGGVCLASLGFAWAVGFGWFGLCFGPEEGMLGRSICDFDDLV